MIRAFVDREEERRILDEEWQKAGGRMIILYGRRRIGKTRLLTEFVQGKQGILSFSEDVTSSIQTQHFHAAYAAFTMAPFSRPQERRPGIKLTYPTH